VCITCTVGNSYFDRKRTPAIGFPQAKLNDSGDL
jgi:hypothetical protein